MGRGIKRIYTGTILMASLKRTKTENINTVILGAGLAGLSAAMHTDAVIFEKEEHIGGTCSSFKKDGFTFDMGIHVLHTKDKYVLDIFSNNNAAIRQKKRSAWIYSYGVLTRYPFQANTFGLPKDIVFQCLNGFIQALKRKKKTHDNYEEWIYSAFGKGIAKNFYLPYSRKFWTIEAKELTTDWLDVRVPRPSLKQVIHGALSPQDDEFGPNALFRYPDSGGIKHLAQALVNKNMKIKLRKKANKLEIKKKVIHFDDGATLRYNNLISTMPLPELFKISDYAPAPVASAVRGLRHNSVLCVNLGVRREKLNNFHWVYFPEEDYIFFRVSFPNNFSKSTAPKGWSSIQAEISYSNTKPISLKGITDRVISGLLKARIIRPQDHVKLISIKDIPYAYVIYDHDRIRNLTAINYFLQNNQIINAGRYGKWEYQWMDNAILDGKRAAALVISSANAGRSTS